MFLSPLEVLAAAGFVLGLLASLLNTRGRAIGWLFATLFIGGCVASNVELGLLPDEPKLSNNTDLV